MYFIDNQGNFYTGDMQFGDREATPEEVSAWESAKAKAVIQQQIDTLETTSRIPRVTREFMLGVMEKEAIDTGITLEQLAVANIGYKKLKDLDNQIKALRKLI